MFDVLKKMEGQQLSEEAVAEACYSDSTVDYNYLQEEQSLSDCDGSTVDTSDAQEKQLSGHDGSTVDTSDEESADSGAIQIKFSDPLQERAMIALFGKDWRNPVKRVEEESEPEDYVSDSEVDVSTDGEDPEAEYEMVPVMDPAYTGPTYHSQACQVHGVMMMPPGWIYRIMRVGPPKSKKAKTEQ